MSHGHELDSLLELELTEASFDSSGSFSVSLEQAMSKLSAFALPRPHSWVLKIIQAAVAAGFQSITIHQKSENIQFWLSGSSDWSVDSLLAEFFSPDHSPGSLDHLKRGLWKVALSQKRPFSLELPGQTGLLWNGQSFHKTPAGARPEAVLTISHSSVRQVNWLQRKIEIAREQVAVAGELTTYAFVCPLPLKLDGRRLDALQFCPTQGLNRQSYPAKIAFIQAAHLPLLRLPPATLGGFQRPKDVSKAFEQVLDLHLEIPAEFSLMCLVSVHFAGDQSGGALHQKNSYLYWIRSGVVVEIAELVVPACGCSLALFASAEGLESDVSTFGLVSGSQQQARLRSLLEPLIGFLRDLEIDTKDMVSAAAGPTRMVAAGLVVGGLVLTLFNGIGGLAVCLPGFFGLSVASVAAVAGNVQEELRRLKVGIYNLTRVEDPGRKLS